MSIFVVLYVISDFSKNAYEFIFNLKINQGFHYKVLIFRTIIHTLFAVHLVRNSFLKDSIILKRFKYLKNV